MKFPTRLLQTAAMAAILLPGFAGANSVTFGLNENNLDVTGTLATVTLTDLAGGGVEFIVDPVSPAVQLGGFVFNVDTGVTITSVNLTYPTANWSYSGQTSNGYQGYDGFGKFDAEVAPNTASEDYRTDNITFTVNGVSDLWKLVDPSTNGSLFAVHVYLDTNGDGQANDGVTGFAGGGTVLPIPAAAVLFGSALLGVVGVGYRRTQAA